MEQENERNALFAEYEEKKLVCERILVSNLEMSETLRAFNTRLATLNIILAETRLRLVASEHHPSVPDSRIEISANLDRMQDIAETLNPKVMKYIVDFRPVEICGQQAFDNFRTVRRKFCEGPMETYLGAVDIYNVSVIEFDATRNKFDGDNFGGAEYIRAGFDSFNAAHDNFDTEFDNMERDLRMESP